MDFDGVDIGNDAAFISHFGKITGVTDGKTLKTSGAGSEDNGIAMTTYTVSDILQGVHAYKPQGLSMNAFNQLMTSQLQQIGTLNPETGDYDVNIAQRLGSRAKFLPDDLMNGSFLQKVVNGGVGYDGTGGDAATGDVETGRGNGDTSRYTDTSGVTNQRQVSAPNGKTIMVGTYNDTTVNMDVMAAWKALVDAASRAGINITGGGWRDHEEQIRLRREHCGSSHYAIYEMKSSGCRPPTARPGTSRHEWGTAVDVKNASVGGAVHNWLKANAGTYGFKQLPSEYWHWSVDGG